MDPGKELRSFIAGTIDSVVTPFAVEFARSSGTRNGAPTLIPVDSGGSQVQGKVLVLSSRIGLDDAQTLLWRRETRNEFSAKRYTRPRIPRRNRVVVESIADFAGLDTVLYTNIGSNIQSRTAEYLATLAISSAGDAAGEKRKDGISYLSSVINHGIVTPLMPEYRNAILRKTGGRNLDEAYRLARLGAGEAGK